MNHVETFVKPAAGVVLRAGLYLAAPAYMISKGEGALQSRTVQVILVVFTPTLVIFGTGALEGAIRAVLHITVAPFRDLEFRKWHVKAAETEFGTMHRLMRAAIVPIYGYSFIAKNFLRYRYIPSRHITNDYMVYRVPSEIAIGTYIFVIKPASKLVWKVVEKTAVGFFHTVASTALIAADIINSGLNAAMNLIDNRR